MLQAKSQTFLRGELIGIEELRGIRPHWDDLCTRVVEENVYYTPQYAHALLDNLPHEDVGVAVVWQGQRLVALLPGVLSSFSLSPLSPSEAWRTPYTFSCTPLLDRELAQDAAGALLDLLARSCGSEWHFPTLNIDGPACQALAAALREAGIPFDFSAGFERAALTRGLSFADYLAKLFPTRRRKDLQRNRRRLEALGLVAHRAYSDGEGLHRAVEAFLSIEASGWKGAQGTALANEPHTKRFAQQAFVEGNSRVDLLTLNGVPIAASVAVFAGRVGFTVKCAYDERYRGYSAGLLLELEVIRSFCEEGWADRLDAATAGAHVIDELWTDRIRVADLLLSFSSTQPELRVAALKGWNDIKREVKEALRDQPISGYLKRLQPRLRRLGGG
ncbi:MAG: GNAT family N-acetyltransferase [Xanthobacteraceae bacterium]|nr:GNAT family N-acetyltransferase [Xanthobacteraceae bacterium]